MGLSLELVVVLNLNDGLSESGQRSPLFWLYRVQSRRRRRLLSLQRSSCATINRKCLKYILCFQTRTWCALQNLFSLFQLIVFVPGLFFIFFFRKFSRSKRSGHFPEELIKTKWLKERRSIEVTFVRWLEIWHDDMITVVTLLPVCWMLSESRPLLVSWRWLQISTAWSFYSS